VPTQNLEAGTRIKSAGKKEGAYEAEPEQEGVLGDAGFGRPKGLEVNDVESTSVHPNNPVE
jgi:hypothetical protein